MTRTGRRSGSGSWLELRVPPVAALLVAVLIAWLCAKAFPALDFDLPGAGWIASAIAFTGILVAAGGVAAFRRHETTVDPRDPSEASAIVTSGVFRYTRNPMYVGLVCLVTAATILLGNLAALAAPLLFAAYLTAFQIRAEERMLLEKFGRPYAEYAMRVRRWF